MPLNVIFSTTEDEQVPVVITAAAIAGIVVGSVIFVVLVIGVVAFRRVILPFRRVTRKTGSIPN